MMPYMRASAFQLGMWLSTLIWAPLSLLTFPLPPLWRYRFITQWTRFNLWWLAVTCGLRYRVRGAEHIPLQPVVVLAKHQSTWETLALQRVLPPHTWVLKRDLLWIPFFGWALALLQPIAIDRGSARRALRQVLEQGRARLRSGRFVVIFPEGTRVAPGHSRRFGAGGAQLALEAGVSVLPVAHNAGTFWPRRQFVKRAGVIDVVIGPVIETQGRSADAVTAQAEEWMAQTMRTLEAPSAGSTPKAATRTMKPDRQRRARQPQRR